MPKEETEAETAETGEGSFDIDDRRRLKQMAYVTSGCGKNKEKASPLISLFPSLQ